MAATGGFLAPDANVVSVETDSVIVSSENDFSFLNEEVFFTEWDNLKVSGESIITDTLNVDSLIANSITAQSIATDVISGTISVEIAGFTASGRITGTGSISTSSWISAATPAFFVKSDVQISGVSVSDYPQINFDLDSYIFATNAGVTYTEAYDGGVLVYAEALPTATLVFDYLVTKG